MYTTVIGRRFLQAYNKREKTNLTAKEFFDDVFFPIAYSSNKYFQWVTNSEFVQGLRRKVVNGKKTDELESFTIEERSKKLKSFHKKIADEKIDASTAIGFSAAESTSYTSGQVSNIKYSLTDDDIYSSWFGSCLGLGVYGNFSIYFNDSQILLDIYDGWKYYRKFLESKEYKKLKGNEIEYWNSQWLAHIASEKYNKENPLQEVSSKIFQIDKTSKISIIPLRFGSLTFSLSRYFGEREILSFIYMLGAKINMTVGFIPFKLYEVRKVIQLYKNLFGKNNYLKDARKIESLYGTAFGFAAACRQGQIGIQALEPKGLREFMTSNKGTAKLPNYTKANEEKIINYNTYITWVIAMLDNEKLWELSGEAAENLIMFIKTDDKNVSTKRSNIVKEVLDAKSKKQFLESLIPMIEQINDPKPFVDLGEEINKMVTANFPYFHTLIRFRYAEKNKN